MKYSEEEEMEIENQLAEMLAHVYVNIPWQKIGVKSAHKFFVDRIRAASGTRDVKEFLDTFTKKCNVNFVKVDPNLVKDLNLKKDLSMNLLRKESVYIANLSLEQVDRLREEKKLRSKGQTTL